MTDATVAQGIAAIARSHALARNVLTELSGQASDPRRRAALERAVTACQQLDRQLGAPISVAFLGGYSTGKSRLIGTLLGDAQLLPSGHAPLTGNVTALKLLAGQPGARPRVRDYAIRFLSQVQMRRYVDYALARLVEVAEAVTVIDLPPLRPILADHPLEAGWEPLAAWLRALPWGQQAHLHALLSVAHDVAVLRVALAEGQGFLGPGAEPSPAMPLADARLFSDVVARGPDGLPDIMPEPVPGARIPTAQRLGALELRRLFPLICQVELDVEIDPTLLEGLAAEQVELLDFAGVDASTSIRDRYLTEAEVGRPVHVVVQAVNALRPQAQENVEIQHMLQRAGLTARQIRDMLLVVVTLADTLPRPTGPAGGDPFAAGQAMAAVRHGVRDLLGPNADRFTLHSADLCCTRGGIPLPTGAEGQLVQERARQNAGAVEVLSRSLSPETDARWWTAVHSLAQDGGLARTRQLVFGHLAGYGLQQKHAAVCRAHDALGDALRELVATVKPLAGAAVPAVSLLRDLKAAAAAQTRELGLLEPAQQASSEVEIVYGLSVWGDVLDRARIGGAPPRTLSHPASMSEWDQFAPTSHPATGSSPLAGTLFAQVADVPVDDTTDGLKQWFTALAEARLTTVEADFLDDVRRRAPGLEAELEAVGRGSDPERVRLLVSMLRALTVKADHLPQLLQHLTTPGRLASLAETVVSDVGPYTRSDLSDRFPLPAHRVLPWSPAHRAQGNRSSLRDYQSLVRFRHQLATALAGVVNGHRRGLLTEFVQRAGRPVRLLGQIPDVPAWAVAKAAPTGPEDASAVDRLRAALTDWSRGTGCGG